MVAILVLEPSQLNRWSQSQDPDTWDLNDINHDIHSRRELTRYSLIGVRLEGGFQVLLNRNGNTGFLDTDDWATALWLNHAT